jgi:hypothetical protein
MNFFRAQGAGIPFEQMRTYDSLHMADDDYARPGGLAASSSPDGMDGGSAFGGAPLEPNDEIVIFSGKVIERIYDGYLVAPEREIARFTVTRWMEMLETGEAWDYEEL